MKDELKLQAHKPGYSNQPTSVAPLLLPRKAGQHEGWLLYD